LQRAAGPYRRANFRREQLHSPPRHLRPLWTAVVTSALGLAQTRLRPRRRRAGIRAVTAS
jgi:hypothetical protein